MTTEYALIPLDCPSCGAAMRADGEDVVYYCTACRNGYRLDLETRVLHPVEVSFIAVADKQVDFYLPFWLLPATITLYERAATGGSFAGLMRFFFSDDQEATGERRGTVVVPAFHAALAGTTELTRRFTEALPSLGEKLGERLIGGCYGIEDARKLAHCVLVESEIAKPDTLTDLRYDIEFDAGSLLGVPFVRQGSGARDAVFGIGLCSALRVDSSLFRVGSRIIGIREAVGSIALQRG